MLCILLVVCRLGDSPPRFGAGGGINRVAEELKPLDTLGVGGCPTLADRDGPMAGVRVFTYLTVPIFPDMSGLNLVNRLMSCKAMSR